MYFMNVSFLRPKSRKSQRPHNVEKLELIQNINSDRTTGLSEQGKHE
jgi:hypothetical protein